MAGQADSFEPLGQTRNPRGELGGGRLEPIHQPATRRGQVSPLQGLLQFDVRPGRLGRSALRVHGGGRKTFARPRDDQVATSQTRHRLDPFTSSTANSRTAGEEERNIAAELCC
jgi:hypothetical protein